MLIILIENLNSQIARLKVLSSYSFSFQAQEIIDAFFIKFNEHAVLNRYNIPYGHTTYGSTCVTGRGGPFSTGDSMNQWIQQVKTFLVTYLLMVKKGSK